MDWQQLTRMAGTTTMVVGKVLLPDQGISIEGNFDLPPLARLSAEDQVFIAAFVKAHGSIKQMESIFGVSYPTIKNRLNRIGAQLDFVSVEAVPDSASVLDRLSCGEIDVNEAVTLLERGENR
ncbi:MAG: DUF2089 domain-containing protein [Candidatus Zixiibacteriota bacterium]